MRAGVVAQESGTAYLPSKSHVVFIWQYPHEAVAPCGLVPGAGQEASTSGSRWIVGYRMWVGGVAEMLLQYGRRGVRMVMCEWVSVSQP